MTELFKEREMAAFFFESAPAACCESLKEKAASCCKPKDGSWAKGKMMITAVIIMAAIGVGAISFVAVTSVRTDTARPARSSSAGLDAKPASCYPPPSAASCCPK